MPGNRIDIARILCPTDFSECSARALERAIRLASWFEARVTVLHVSAPLPWPLPPDALTPHVAAPADVLLAERERAERDLERFVAPLRQAGAAIETRLLDGDPARQIRAVADALPADLLVMGTHGRSGFEHLILGSVTEKMLRRASCPVLTVGHMARTSVGPLFRRIVCAADLSKASRRTLDMALSLAERHLARVTFLHVVESLPGEAGSVDEPLDAATPRTDLIEQARERLRQALPEAASHRCEVQERVETGSPWRQILRVAQETDADLVVVGAHGGSSASRMFFGSTANHVVRQASCPVLVVRELEAARPAREAAGAGAAAQ